VKKQKVGADYMEDKENLVEKFIRENNVQVVDTAYVYIIETKTGGFYTGVSKDFFKRWRQHFLGTGAKYIKANGFKKPIFLQTFDSLGEAMKEEKRIKKMSRKQKENLVKSDNNILDSLYFINF